MSTAACPSCRTPRRPTSAECPARDTLAAALVAQKVQRFLLDNADITTVMDALKRSDTAMSIFTRYAMDALMKTTHPEVNRKSVLEPAPPPHPLHSLQGHLPLWR